MTNSNRHGSPYRTACSVRTQECLADEGTARPRAYPRMPSGVGVNITGRSPGTDGFPTVDSQRNIHSGTQAVAADYRRSGGNMGWLATLD